MLTSKNYQLSRRMVRSQFAMNQRSQERRSRQRLLVFSVVSSILLHGGLSFVQEGSKQEREDRERAEQERQRQLQQQPTEDESPDQ